MSYQNQTIDAQMYDMGQTMKKISTWIWLTIFLFILIFPPIVLLVKLFKFAKKARQLGLALNDSELEKAGKQMKTALILNLIPLGVTQLIGLIFQIMSLSEFNNWSKRFANARPSPNMQKYSDGFNWIFLGTIIGLFTGCGAIFIPIGFSKAGKAIMQEFGAGGPTLGGPQQGAYQQTAYQQPVYQQPAYQQPAYQQPAYQQPAYQQPAYQQPAYQQPAYQQPAPTPACPFCGAQLKQPGQKFCNVCGQQISQ